MKWIFSYSIKSFALDAAIHELKSIDWSIDNKIIEKGDEIYLYSGAPEKRIRYKCIVANSDKEESTVDDSAYGGNPAGTPGRWAEIVLEKEFVEPGITYGNLLEHGLKSGTLTKRKITHPDLLQYITEFEQNENNVFTGEYQPPMTDNTYLWLIAPGEDAYMFDAFYQDGIAAIDWHYLNAGDLLQYEDINDIASLGLSSSDTRCLWEFSHEIMVGDIIVAKKGVHDLLGIGVVTREYYYVDSDEYFSYNTDDKHKGNYRHRIGVNWLSTKRVASPKILPRKTLTHYEGEKRDYYLSLYNLTIGEIAPRMGTLVKAETIIEEIEDTSILHGGEKETIIKARINQSAYRDLLIKKYGKCCLCGMSNQKLLIASHIKPWAKSDPIEKTDDSNGLLLCPNHDKLFDSGLISFNSDGSVIVSKALSKEDCKLLNINERQRITVDGKMASYLEYHWNNIFKGDEES